MERSLEFYKVCKDVLNSPEIAVVEGEYIIETNKPEPSIFMQQALNISHNIGKDEELVKKMERLTRHKEFSNDPTDDINEISKALEKDLAELKREIEQLKSESASKQGSLRLYHERIFKQLSETIKDIIISYKNALETHEKNKELRLKRVSKFGKGSSDSSSKFGGSNLTSTIADTGKYAMFNRTPAVLDEQPIVAVQKGGDFRNRRNNSTAAVSSTTTTVDNVVSHTNDSANVGNSSNSTGGHNISSEKYNTPPTSQNSSDVNKNTHNSTVYEPFNSKNTAFSSTGNISGNTITARHARSTTNNASNSSGNSSGNNGASNRQSYNATNTVNNFNSSNNSQQQQQVYNPKQKDVNRLSNAKRVEESITQMGQLFSQMATLVSQQSETITRIEDDVESGLQDTIEATASIQHVYEITKGNRGMILKIFGILAFFVVLFLYWT